MTRVVAMHFFISVIILMWRGVYFGETDVTGEPHGPSRAEMYSVWHKQSLSGCHVGCEKGRGVVYVAHLVLLTDCPHVIVRDEDSL